MKETLKSQYDLILESRAILLDYCDTLTSRDFLANTPGFGHDGSIRNLLVHVCNTYSFWIGEHSMGKPVRPFPPYDNFTTVDHCRGYFNTVNQLVWEFLDRFADDYTVEFTSVRGDKSLTASALATFTHACTHEFHHKGQVLSMSRHMGYIPVDTDILR